ncbi:carboxylesterase family protein [Variovorax sp. VRV01]|uniref:carboxylesterase family protein n=1 Tax=Variovorax sp. VRV01 TaxID=2769259 RepID=UPI001CE21144|nr:carboxylesterase family protein [Variovorax sp. VRV01]
MNPSASREPLAADRRRFVLAAGALAALPLAGCGGGGGGSGGFPAVAVPPPAPAPAPAPAPDTRPVADTSSGKLRGQRSADGSIVSFLGVPYAQPPVGALRFRSPQAYRAAAGTFEASAFGAAALQTLPPYVTWIYPRPDRQDEDCLSLNVWAPSQDGRLPVVVWLHGGAWRTGATSMPLMHGEALARKGVVVVTANFRLGVLGTLSHPDLADPDTGMQANWQLQDQIAVLQWVRENAQAFGGDPGNVTLIGQSAGGTSGAILAQNPVARACFHKALLMSPAGVPPPTAFTLADAATYAQALAARLDTTPAGLRNIPAQTLHNAELALNALPLPAGITSGRGLRAAPVIDGRTCLGDWTRTAWPADMPLMLTNTLTEGSFFLDAYDPATQAMLTPPLPASRSELLALVTPQAGGSQANADAVIDAYASAAASDNRPSTPGDLWIEIYGDRVLRNFGVRYAARVAQAGGNVRYATYAHEIVAPGRGVPHCAELPMLFGSYGLDYYRDKVGAGPAEAQLADILMNAVVSFARGGNAQLGAGAAWPGLADLATSAVSLGAAGDAAGFSIGAVPKLAQLGIWDSILGY